jgi:hypothetical protein
VLWYLSSSSFYCARIRLDKEKCWLSLKLILGLLNRLLSIGGQMTLKFERSCCFYKGNKSTCRKPSLDLTFSHIQKKECTLSFKKVVCHVWQVLILLIGCLKFITFWLKKSKPKFLELFSISEYPRHSHPLLICTWIMKFLVWKIKFDEIYFLSS